MSLPGIQTFVKNGTLVFTLTSNGYKYYTMNLVEHLKRAKVPWRLCIICADKPSQQFLRGQGVTALLAPTILRDTGPEISRFGTTDFQRLNRLKLDLLHMFVLNPDIKHGIYMDGDIAVYNDFVPDMIERLSTSPLLLQCDELTRLDCSGCPNACTGFIGWSHGVSPSIFHVTPATFDIWRSRPEDQVFVNAMMQREAAPFKTLPRDLYPNGQFTRLYSPASPLKGIAKLLHYNFLVGPDKQRRMKANGDWLIPL